MLELVLLVSMDSHEVLPNQKKGHQEEEHSAHQSRDKAHAHSTIFGSIFQAESIVSRKVQSLEGVSDH